MKSLSPRSFIPALRNLLLQGASPAKLALAVSMGAVVAVCPMVGIPTPLCAFLAIRWKLNLVVAQTANYLMAGPQWLLMIPFLRAGEWLFRRPRFPLSLSELRGQLAENFWETSLWFWKSAFFGMLVWLMLAPVVGYLLYRICFALFSRMANVSPTEPTPPDVLEDSAATE